MMRRTRSRKTRKANMTMAIKAAEAGAAETTKEETMALVTEKAVEVMIEVVNVVEEVEEATPTTTMEEEIVAASIEAEEEAKV